MLALLSSMSFESDLILPCLKNARTVKIAGRPVYKGNLSGHDIILINMGIGKVNASHSATIIIEKFPVKDILNLGVGGAYPGSGLKIGDIAIASKEIYGDEGVISSKGFKGLKEIGIPLVQKGKKKYFNEFPLDTTRPIHLSVMGGKVGDKGRFESLRIKSGIFVTVSASTGTQKKAIELEKRFHAVCENMEGAAIAQVCAIYKIPMFEIRGISNIVGIRDKRKWNLKLASENCQKVVAGIMHSLI
jgi:futalosine hydrolase